MTDSDPGRELMYFFQTHLNFNGDYKFEVEDHQEKRQEHCPSCLCLTRYPQKTGLLSTEGYYFYTKQ